MDKTILNWYKSSNAEALCCQDEEIFSPGAEAESWTLVWLVGRYIIMCGRSALKCFSDSPTEGWRDESCYMQTLCTDSRLGGNLNTGFVWRDDEEWADVVCLNPSRCVADLQNSFKGSVHCFYMFHAVYHKFCFKWSALCFPENIAALFDVWFCLIHRLCLCSLTWRRLRTCFCNVTHNRSFVSVCFFCCVAQTLVTEVLSTFEIWKTAGGIQP